MFRQNRDLGGKNAKRPEKSLSLTIFLEVAGVKIFRNSRRSVPKVRMDGGAKSWLVFLKRGGIDLDLRHMAHPRFLM